MSTSDVYYRRNLPHFQPTGYPLFITFNLADSLPSNVIAELKAQRAHELKYLSKDSSNERYNVEKKYFGRYDDWLDRCKEGPHWLKEDGVAQIVANKIHGMDKDHYELLCYCIMSNHVHLLIELYNRKKIQHQGQSAKYPGADTLRLLKGSTARECNLVLGRAGNFWHHESYDHYARDENELGNIIKYVINNPVKAGLVMEWTSWKFTFINPKLGSW